MSNLTSRRAFLKQAAAGAALVGAPLVIPSSALGADGAVAPSNKITLGCIGVGGQGTGNMRSFLGINEARVVAVCDTYEDRRKRAKGLVDKEHGDDGCAMFGDFRELLARNDVDAVMIATQDHWHAVIALAAVAAGKDMYLEKPLGVAVKECQAIREAVRRSGRIVQIGTQQRSSRNFRHACELARNGYMGKPHTVQVAPEGPNYKPSYKGPMAPQPVPAGFDWDMWLGPAPRKPYNPGRVAWPDWYLIWDYCTGFIVNWGVHHLDIANWGCPDIGRVPFEVEAKVKHRDEGFTDNSESWMATFTYQNGLKMIYSDHFQQKLGIRFIGERGWVHVDRAGIWADPESLLKVTIKPDELHLHESNSHHGNFIQSVKARKDPVSDVDAGHIASYLGMVADIGGRLQRKLKWDPKAEQFIGDDEANRMLGRPMRAPWHL
jgi:predicted dehydrogenase